MAINLSGLPIIITGASSGIGRATALACARAGMPVTISARRASRLESLRDEIISAGGKALAVECDVTDPGACARMVEDAENAHGPTYSVYANAGYGLEAPILEMTDDEVRAIFETNFFGTLNTIRPVVGGMIERKKGHVLVCASCVAKMSLPYYSAYSATKASQAHIARALNMELSGTGVRTSTICPAGTKTEFFDLVGGGGDAGHKVTHTRDSMLQTPEFVARQIVKCLRKPKLEVWPGISGKFVRFGMSMCTLFPIFADMGTRSHVKQYRSHG